MLHTNMPQQHCTKGIRVRVCSFGNRSQQLLNCSKDKNLNRNRVMLSVIYHLNIWIVNLLRWQKVLVSKRRSKVFFNGFCFTQQPMRD